MLPLAHAHLAVAIRVSRLLPGAAEPPQRSLVSAPTATTAATAAPLQLLAFVDDSEAAVGSLRLEQESEFAVRASSLRLPKEEHDEVARQLLWHAVREMPALRRESALLACPASEEDVGALHSLGFAPVSAGEEAKTLALVTRRDPAEPAGFSHVTLRVSSIKTSLAFWSLLHYAPSRTFTSNGARTAWLSAPWTALSVELIEVPEVMLSQMAKSLLTPSTEALGPAHLCLDVTSNLHPDPDPNPSPSPNPNPNPTPNQVRLPPISASSGAISPRSRRAPALQILSAISPIYSSNPVFYSATFDDGGRILQPGRFRQYALDLSTTVEGERPRFVASPRAAPAQGLTNEDYRAAIASWLEPHGEAAFAAFYAQRKNYQPPAALSCNATSDNFDECLSCTGGCRVAFACFHSHGTASEDFAACLAENT